MGENSDWILLYKYIYISCDNCGNGFTNNQGVGVNKIICKKENSNITNYRLMRFSVL